MNNLKIIAHVILSVLSWGFTVYAVGGFFLNIFGVTNLQYGYLLLSAIVGVVVLPFFMVKNLSKIDAAKYRYGIKKNKSN